MELKDIATVAGKSGLYKVTKPTRTGVILESLDKKKSKFATGPNHRVSLLNEISIYTTDAEGSLPLEQLFKRILDEFGDDTGLTSSSANEELKAFLQHVMPEHDPERVYVSDIKKIISWYNLLIREVPELFENIEETTEAAEVSAEKEAANDKKSDAANGQPSAEGEVVGNE